MLTQPSSSPPPDRIEFSSIPIGESLFIPAPSHISPHTLAARVRRNMKYFRRRYAPASRFSIFLVSSEGIPSQQSLLPPIGVQIYRLSDSLS